MNSVAERLAAVRERIQRAAAEAGRDASGIRLLAASKTKSPELIREAYAAGQRDFGENYVQELTDKAEALSDLADLRFHMIGHLQRNKARHVVGTPLPCTRSTRPSSRGSSASAPRPPRPRSRRLLPDDRA